MQKGERRDRKIERDGDLRRRTEKGRERELDCGEEVKAEMGRWKQTETKGERLREEKQDLECGKMRKQRQEN